MKDMLVERIFKKKLEDYLTHTKDDNTLYVTDLIRCPLKIQYEKTYKELAISEVFTPSTILGDMVHEGLENFIKNNFSNSQVEVEIEREIPVNNKQVKIKGRIDAIAEIDGEKVVIEIKSARADKGLPHEHHKVQLQIYLWMTGIKKGLLVYITPDRVTEYEVNEPADEVGVIRLAEETLKRTKVPRYPWECGYCVYSSVCPYKRNK
ncbi:CRISPR-associated protein Cas4 [Sulfurisphaera ohwakuensis]|uniref:CRISPR-associated exonuclease Cas4 n=2 Tax=Sulfurisphaera ohwakuensis TaxID=69656 RepID=A0A7J9RTN9_SULOH|nr:CRISPR-associated protein Cas4 [Sulfurisphaera ohwakuensis]MBB5253896.1 CRISPR-associated exonuclease Cas4 [Sulfurisphaera ohwakuensis]